MSSNSITMVPVGICKASPRVTMTSSIWDSNNSRWVITSLLVEVCPEVWLDHLTFAVKVQINSLIALRIIGIK